MKYSFNNFEKFGFFIGEVENFKNLKKIKDKIFQYSKNKFSIKTKNQNHFFDNFHKRELSPANLNKYRQELNTL